MLLSDTDRGLTAQEIADRVGISKSVVYRKRGIDDYLLGTTYGGGRPAQIWRPDVLSLWLGERYGKSHEKHIRRRSDCGVPRKCSPEQWKMIVSRVYDLFMKSAQPNLKYACEIAERQLLAEGNEVPINIYKRLTRKKIDHDGRFISEFFEENWEMVHASAWRKKDISIAMPTVRFEWLSIFEKEGWAGQGFGALRVWSIDVRKADVWAKDYDGKKGMPRAIYIRCGLTGFPLWIEPIKTELSEDIIRAYLNCGLAWGMYPDIACVLDNGKAMIARATQGVLLHTMPQEARDRALQYPELFGRVDPSPVMLNIPNVPQFAFKAALERSFKLMKDEYDSTRHPRLYQGGSRKEGVQLNLRGMPHLPDNLLTAAEYYEGLMQWMYSDYIRRPRPRMFPLLEERGLAPTILTAFEHYGGFEKRNVFPEGEALAYLLYWTTPPHRRKPMKPRAGYIDQTRDGQYNRWQSEALDHTRMRHKVAVIPVPGMERSKAVLMLADDPAEPRFIGYASNALVRSIEEMGQAKQESRKAMGTIREKLKEGRDAQGDGAWKNGSEPLALPAANGQTVGTLHEAPTPAPAEDYDDSMVDLSTMSEETQDLLSDLDDLLSD